MAAAKRTVLFGAALVVVVGFAVVQGQKEQRRLTDPNPTSAREMYMRYCASCHGRDGTGDGPAAIAMKTPPPDLTALAKRYGGKYPAGYVGALLKFGRSMASHGSDEMPVWGSRFKMLDPEHDSTGQQHVDAIVAYVESLQVK